MRARSSLTEPYSLGSGRGIEDVLLGRSAGFRAVPETGREGEGHRRDGISGPERGRRDGAALRLGQGSRAALEVDGPRRRAARALERDRSRVPAGAVTGSIWGAGWLSGRLKMEV